jgi:hypothetical protein
VKKLLLISCLLLAGLVPAKADTLPKNLIGTWCPSGGHGGTYEKNKNCSELDKIRIDKQGLKYWEVYCTFININLNEGVKGVFKIMSSCEEGEDKRPTTILLYNNWKRKDFLAIEYLTNPNPIATIAMGSIT